MCEVHKPHLYPSSPDKVLRICEKCFDSWACKDSCDDGNEKECFHPRPGDVREAMKVQPMPDPAKPVFLPLNPKPEPMVPLVKAAPQVDFEGHGQQMTAPCTIPMTTYHLPDLPGLAVRFKTTGEVGVVQSIAPCHYCEAKGVVMVEGCTCGANDPEDGSAHEPGCGKELCGCCSGTALLSKVWVLKWVGLTVPVLELRESALDGWEPLPKESQEAKPESCLEPIVRTTGNLVPGGL